MKPVLVREKSYFNSSIEFDDREYEYFYNPLHYHPELELTLIIKSFGQRQVGDSIENFGSGDIVLVGKNLPHVWKNDGIYFKDDTSIKAQAIVLKFLPDFAGNDLLERPEMKGIHHLIHHQAPFGVKLEGDLRKTVEAELLMMSDLDDTDRFISLINVLNTIAKSREYVLLANLAYRDGDMQKDHRINVILDYIMDHFQDELDLETVASRISMNKNAFCRFFKKGTRKRLTEVIHEVRVSKACQYLIETELNVLQICYACGFGNVSSFNTTFKKLKGTTPLAYRKTNSRPPIHR